MKATFVDRLNEVLKQKEISQSELSRLTGISQSTLNGWINGQYIPRQDKVDVLAKALRVSPAYLMGWDDDSTVVDNIMSTERFKTKIPLIGTIAAGTPVFADENFEEYVNVEKFVNADFCLRVKGTSMINANINDGDIVFIHKQPMVEDGEIAAVLIDDSATLKRVYKIGNLVQLRAENPEFAPITLNGDEEVVILGKATYKIGKIR